MAAQTGTTAINYAVTNGIIEKDYANYTKAQMNAPVTRSEAAAILLRMFETSTRKSITLK